MKQLLLGLIVGLAWACASNAHEAESKSHTPRVASRDTSQTQVKSPPLYPKMDSLITLTIGGHLVDVRSPKQVSKGNILVLPGWNFPRQDWCNKSSLCQKALAAGYRLVLPEMGQSVYSSQFYPETRPEWRKFPNLSWVLDSLLPTLQSQHKIFLPEQDNFILGLSTGGRGVALIALNSANIWRAGAALSGDFDQSTMPQDRLMTGYYGSFYQFKARWLGADNPQKQVDKFTTPLYLGHGTADKIVPASQTKSFYEALKKAQPDLKLVLHLPAAAHDYNYWNSEVENMLNFFEEIRQSKD